MKKIAILYYHRINELTTDYNLTNVKPSHFEEQMDVVVNNYEVVSTADLLSGCAFKSDKNAVVVTFDDGYKDILYNAGPIMESFGIPFTCFITTENISTNSENWTDLISRIVFEPEIYHEECELVIDGERNVYRVDCIEDRVKFYRLLQKICGSCLRDGRRETLAYLMKWAGISSGARSAFGIMDEKEICGIKDIGGIIGAHTVSHSYFSALSDDDILWEINESKKMLERIIGGDVFAFSYPFGDAPKKVRAMLEASGYSVAMTSKIGFVTKQSDLMYLPRVNVRDYSKDDFEKYLAHIFV